VSRRGWPRAVAAPGFPPGAPRREDRAPAALGIRGTEKRAVTKKIPDYLRLHREDSAGNPPDQSDVRGLDALCRSFHRATGWQLSYQPADVEHGWGGCGSPGSAERETGRVVLSRNEQAEGAVAYEDIQPLATAIGSLVEEIHRTRHVVWQREAELAAGIPVAIRSDEDQHFAARLEAVLRGGAEAIGCQAAALYLLDDATSHLKLRACWRLPYSRFLELPRPLRGAVADLEALVGHAVALEDTSLLPHWRTPENFPAALCVPVSSAATPLGTLWFFADRAREFSSQQTHLAELVAGRLVSDLERETLIRESLRGRQADRTLQVLSNWQREQRPYIPPLVEGWQVAGRSEGTEELGGDYYDWCVLPDGRLAVAAGHAEGTRVEAALTAATVQIAMKAHAVYRHEPRQMVSRLNEALWTHSTGHRFASLFYGVIDPESGSVQFASAGSVQSLSCSPLQVRTVNEEQPMLGADPDSRFHQKTFVLEAGDSLLIFSRCQTVRSTNSPSQSFEDSVAHVLQSCERATAEEQLQAIFENQPLLRGPERTAVVARRLS